MNQLNIERLLNELGAILSEKHGADIKFHVRLKEEHEHEQERKESA